MASHRKKGFIHKHTDNLHSQNHKIFGADFLKYGLKFQFSWVNGKKSNDNRTEILKCGTLGILWSWILIRLQNPKTVRLHYRVFKIISAWFNRLHGKTVVTLHSNRKKEPPEKWGDLISSNNSTELNAIM